MCASPSRKTAIDVCVQSQRTTARPIFRRTTKKIQNLLSSLTSKPIFDRIRVRTEATDTSRAVLLPTEAWNENVIKAAIKKPTTNPELQKLKIRKEQKEEKHSWKKFNRFWDEKIIRRAIGKDNVTTKLPSFPQNASETENNKRKQFLSNNGKKRKKKKKRKITKQRLQRKPNIEGTIKNMLETKVQLPIKDEWKELLKEDRKITTTSTSPLAPTPNPPAPPLGPPPFQEPDRLKQLLAGVCRMSESAGIFRLYDFISLVRCRSLC